jgi:signal transduction histidine kinase
MFIFIVSLSIINFVNLFVINEILTKYEVLYYRVYPDFLTNVNSPEKSLDLKDKYSRVILLWEGILILTTSLLLYIVIDRYLKKEERYKSFLQLLILAISHKFGNSLSSIITNLEILKQTEDKKSLTRIERVVNTLSSDIKTLSETFKNLPLDDRKEEIVDIKQLILESLKNFDYDKKILLNLKPIKKYTSKVDLEIVFHNLLENSFKYSNSFVHIKMIKKCLIIKNDINSNTEGGNGIGLLIVENLCKLNGVKFKKRSSKNSYLVILDFS